ncbi:DUF2997 domain-containing protein [Synechococcus elongatus]|uniref:DUF2997 domain-containing protein n=2 Tax=Synechococcus elongatus TaxID=32046 RepID=Q31MD8_SYNE7|nr:DUF2997 domain-containing protein [Synechococcus elongatus]ABB57781.1 conserved hypothetical protein [Synechococcus elongatus PCC 7942 = FACHB-805]AJD57731.1 hypothetical protein M744_07725 [Synechococcus elongatus UTEX 2973]MBD2586497.1 DUF2997 domain-containing protein [Synechococcus elongatus FACHB-242]MBD2687571.1 DUF2997 domain-containing protein [Synechococcus elongatus FACHB-1061]MBD2706720.1 DUF2997 domain-containing protein [Synechococcus elongatus PCC 7942 = FACHB-805]
MTLETLEFVIHPDGRVEEQVTGIQGKHCTEITAEIEAQLGQVVTHQPSADYFANAVVVASVEQSTVH